MRSSVKVSVKEIWRMIELYNTLGEFIEKFVDKKLIYKKEFINGLNEALKEIKKGKTKQVKNFTDFIS